MQACESSSHSVPVAHAGSRSRGCASGTQTGRKSRSANPWLQLELPAFLVASGYKWQRLQAASVLSAVLMNTYLLWYFGAFSFWHRGA